MNLRNFSEFRNCNVDKQPCIRFVGSEVLFGCRCKRRSCKYKRLRNQVSKVVSVKEKWKPLKMGNYETWAILLFSVAQCAYAVQQFPKRVLSHSGQWAANRLTARDRRSRRKRKSQELGYEIRIDNQAQSIHYVWWSNAFAASPRVAG